MKHIQLRDTIPLVLETLTEFGYSNGYMNTIKRHLNQVIDQYADIGITHYTPGQYEIFLSIISGKYESGNLRIDLFWSYRKCAHFLDEYCRFGYVRPKYLFQHNRAVLKDAFKDLFESYLASLVSKVRDTTIAQRSYAIQKYLRYLQDQGHSSFKDVNLNDIQNYFMNLSKEISNRTLNQNRLHIRQFHIYLAEINRFVPNWLSFLDFKVIIPRKIQGYLTTKEINSILAQIPTNTDIGKRDYAIISFARTTGLRGCDIIKLKLADIDWTTGVITIRQSKTGVLLYMPLLTETGEALKEYIINGRPKSPYQEIFLRVHAPYTPLRSTSSLDALLRKYQKASGTTRHLRDGKAFHGMRRGLGRDLVLAGVPVTGVMQILGHTHIDSGKPYMMLNTPELMECSLGLSDIPVERGDLL